MFPEVWRKVNGGYYAISTEKRVVRIRRGFHTRPGKVLKPKKGWVTLNNGGVVREVSVHALYLETFVKRGTLV